jgi:hypothetical protein
MGTVPFFLHRTLEGIAMLEIESFRWSEIGPVEQPGSQQFEDRPPLHDAPCVAEGAKDEDEDFDEDDFDDDFDDDFEGDFEEDEFDLDLDEEESQSPTPAEDAPLGEDEEEGADGFEAEEIEEEDGFEDP